MCLQFLDLLKEISHYEQNSKNVLYGRRERDSSTVIYLKLQKSNEMHKLSTLITEE